MGCVNFKKARKSFWKYGSELDNPDRVFLVVCAIDETPYTEAVLFDHGQEVACTEPCFDNITGTYSFEYQGDIYFVNVQVSE